MASLSNSTWQKPKERPNRITNNREIDKKARCNVRE